MGYSIILGVFPLRSVIADTWDSGQHKEFEASSLLSGKGNRCTGSFSLPLPSVLVPASRY